MGTRSLTHVLAEDGGTLVTIYRQYDGYPSGMGRDLAGFLSDRKVVNGYGEPDPKVSNGMGCLAASLVKELKEETGYVYMMTPGTSGSGEEYVYTIRKIGSFLNIRCVSVAWGDEYPEEVLYDGSPEGFMEAFPA